MTWMYYFALTSRLDACNVGCTTVTRAGENHMHTPTGLVPTGLVAERQPPVI